jgi:hypothetical protein
MHEEIDPVRCIEWLNGEFTNFSYAKPWGLGVRAGY